MLGDLLVDGLQIGVGQIAGFDDTFSKGDHGITRFPAVDLFLRSITTLPHAFGMHTSSIGSTLNQRRATTRPSSRHCLLGGFVDGDHIIAVHLFRVQSISGSSTSDVRIACGVGEGDLRRIHVVLTDKHDRQIIDRGQIDPLVERTIADSAIAEEGDADLVGLQQLKGVTRTCRLQDAGTHDAAGTHHADFGRKQVHASASPPRTTRLTPEQLCHQFSGWHTFGQRVTMSAMRTEDGIVVAQVGTDAGGNRFFAYIRMARPRNRSRRIGASQLLLALSYQHHRAIERQQFVR